MSLKVKTTPGIFVSECKNRFLSNVKIADEIVECYVPSSSRIENYLQVDGCKVLLTENKSKKSRTRYSLFVVSYQNNYIILNLNKVNSVVEQFIEDKVLYAEAEYKVYKEKVVEGVYKSDLYLSDLEGNNDVIIEAKGVISAEKTIDFPQVYSERSLKQLDILYRFLEEGRIVHYYLICLSPFINKIKLTDGSEYTRMLKKCIERGLELKVIKFCFDGENISLEQDVQIIC